MNGATALMEKQNSHFGSTTFVLYLLRLATFHARPLRRGSQHLHGHQRHASGQRFRSSLRLRSKYNLFPSALNLSILRMAAKSCSMRLIVCLQCQALEPSRMKLIFLKTRTQGARMTNIQLGNSEASAKAPTDGLCST